MAVLDHHHDTAPSENHCAVQFCLTWVGFFVLVGAVAWIVSAL
jgi:hypothetical protein